MEIFFASKTISLFCFINSEDDEFKKNEDKNKTEPKSTREQFEKFWARVQRAHNQEKD